MICSQLSSISSFIKYSPLVIVTYHVEHTRTLESEMPKCLKKLHVNYSLSDQKKMGSLFF